MPNNYASNYCQFNQICHATLLFERMKKKLQITWKMGLGLLSMGKNIQTSKQSKLPAHRVLMSNLFYIESMECLD
jgi:hypothetical protein